MKEGGEEEVKGGKESSWVETYGVTEGEEEWAEAGFL